MVVGFVGGVADCPRFFRRFRQHCFFGVLQDVLRLSCTRPAYLPRVINLFKRSRSGVRYSEDAFLLALGVSPDRRRHGIAEQLLTAFGDAMRVKGVNAYALTTETCGNEAANRFYQKQGLQLVRSFEPPGREVFVNEYRCDLRSKAGRLGMEP
jgi:ribosomal protein S18 acetylase RimI-like enzyme